MKAKTFLIVPVLVSLFLMLNHATAQDNVTIREIPPAGSGSKNGTAPKHHPEYKKLLDELTGLKEQLKSTDDESAARARQAVDAAFTRLFEYIDAGGETFLPGASQPLASGGSYTGKKAASGQSVGESRKGTGGAVDQNRKSSCYANILFYEKINSEGWTPTMANDVSLSSNEYALQWQGQSFYVEHTRTHSRDDYGGGLDTVSVLIKGRLSNDYSVLETITFEEDSNAQFKELGEHRDSDHVTLVNIPLYQVKKVGGSKLYSFLVKGADAVRKHVQQISTGEGPTKADLRWEFAEDEQVLGRDYGEPTIHIEIYKPL